MKILVPTARGVIEDQWMLSLEECGRQVVSHDFNPYGTDNSIDSIRRLAAKEEIEAVICYEDDSRETLLDVCTEHDIPLIMWHLDAPYKYFLPEYTRKYKQIEHFCMDRYYVNLLQELGYEKVCYLPIGTTPGIFRPLKSCNASFRAEVGFVGNLLIGKAKAMWDSIMSNWKGSDDDYQLVRELISVAADRGIDIPMTIQLLAERGLGLELALYIIKFVEMMAVQDRRKRPALALRDHVDLKVVGDDWGYVGIRRDQIQPRIGYYDELPVFYGSVAINFNVTQPQVKSGLNQRFFDVPACGGFLISDPNDEISRFFVRGEEIVTYTDVKEIPEIVRYYLDHVDEREAIAQAAREKVLAHHTMKKRMEVVIQALGNGA